ncbi:MAG TPA: ABC transporter permease [Jiangellaceae bacterium]|nr:ABC transporter permease [Jiangellaceae bacterium]
MASASTTTIGARTRPRRTSRWRRIVTARLPGVLSVVGFVALWQLLIEIFDPNPILFPPPAAVAEAFVEALRDGTMWPAVADSMSAMAIGLAWALAFGIPLGLIIGMSPTADLITSPYLWGFFAMPRIALAPLMILWLGFGMETKVWLVFLSAVIPLMLSCKDGVQTVDTSMIAVARSFGAGRVALFGKVIAPSTLPFIASGIRNGISRGFVGLLVIELTVGSGGIGTQVMRSMRQFDTARMFAFALVLVVIALTLISLSRRLENLASRWREEVSL